MIISSFLGIVKTNARYIFHDYDEQHTSSSFSLKIIVFRQAKDSERKKERCYKYNHTIMLGASMGKQKGYRILTSVGSEVHDFPLMEQKMMFTMHFKLNQETSVDDFRKELRDDLSQNKRRIKDIFYHLKASDEWIIKRSFFDGKNEKLKRIRSTTNNYFHSEVVVDGFSFDADDVVEFTRLTYLRCSGFNMKYGKYCIDWTNYGTFITFKFEANNKEELIEKMRCIGALMVTHKLELISLPKAHYIKQKIDINYPSRLEWLLMKLPETLTDFNEARVSKECIIIGEKKYQRVMSDLPFWDKPYPALFFKSVAVDAVDGTYDGLAVVMIFKEGKEIRGSIGTFCDGFLVSESLEYFCWTCV